MYRSMYLSAFRTWVFVTACAVAAGGEVMAQEPQPDWEGAWQWLHDTSDGRLLIVDNWFCAVFGAKDRAAPTGPLAEAVRASLYRSMSGPMCGPVAVEAAPDGSPVMVTTVEFTARPHYTGRVARRRIRVEGARMEGDVMRSDGSVAATWQYRRLSPLGTGPLAGAWRLAAADWDGLLVLTDSEYRFVIHRKDRSDLASGSPGDLTDSEAAALYDAYDAEGGVYERTATSFVRIPAIARDPRLQGQRLETALEVHGDTLRLEIGDRSFRWLRGQSQSVPVPVQGDIVVEWIDSWGERGTDPGQFRAPYLLAWAPNGTLYLGDLGNRRIQYFTKDGELLGTFGSEGRGEGQFILAPMATPGPDGHVYVGDCSLDRVQVFTPDGRFLRSWGTPGTEPGQIQCGVVSAVDSDGTLYVNDYLNHRVQVFSNEWEFQTTWGSHGTEPGQFQRPSQIAIGPNDLLYVADALNHRVQVFTKSGDFVRQWGGPGEDLGQMNSPCCLAISDDGLVFVGDVLNDRIQVFDLEGRFVGSWGELGVELGEFTAAAGVAVAPGPAGTTRVWVAEMGFAGPGRFRRPDVLEGGNRIQVFDVTRK